MNCPACGCPDSRHWPDHGEVTTACLTCLDAQHYVETRPGARGICCFPAADIRLQAQP